MRINLFDNQGNIALCFQNDDVSSAKAKKEAYYYVNRKMVALSDNGLLVLEKDFVTEDVELGVGMLQTALSYKTLFDSIVKVQYKEK